MPDVMLYSDREGFSFFRQGIPEVTLNKRGLFFLQTGDSRGYLEQGLIRLDKSSVKPTSIL